jgi:Flp pilus assembly protein TadD
MTSLLDDAIVAYREKRFQEAGRLLETVCETEVDNHKAQFFLAKSHLALGRQEEARRAFRQLAQSANARVAEMANQELAALQGTPAPTPIFNCPQCARAVPAERATELWCECGWGRRRESGQVLYVAHIMACVRKRLAPPVEINFGGDLYEIGAEVRVKHMIARRSVVDPRVVFPVSGGQPVLTKKDLSLVMGHADKSAVFRESRGLGRMYSWDAYLEHLRKTYPDSQQQPDNSLRSLLLSYGGLSEAQVVAAEQEADGRSLGQVLLARGVCSFEDMLAAAVGPSRYYKPAHHHDNQFGYMLLQAGAINEAELTEALSAQLRDRRPLSQLLAPKVELAARQQASKALKDLRLVGPERDGIGEVLCAMGKLGRTALAHGLREQQAQNKHLGQVLVDGGHISQHMLFEAVKRQELKRSLRMGPEVRLGEILLRQGACDPAGLEWALHAQVHRAQPLGAILASEGVCSPEHLIAALIEQEDRLDVLVERRLPAMLLEAREAAKRYAPKLPPRQAPRPTTQAKQVAGWKPSPLLNGLAWAGGFLLVGALVFTVAGAVANSPLFKRAEPPVVKALKQNNKAAPLSPALTKIYTNPKVEVNADDVMKRIDADDPNPLGEGYIGAYRKPVPATLETASRHIGRSAGNAPGTKAKAASPRGMPPGFERGPGHVVALQEDLELDGADDLLDRDGAVGARSADGDRLMVMERHRDAAKAYRAALAATPGDPALLAKVARAERLAGNATGANAALTQAVKSPGGSPEALNELGRTMVRAGKPELAAKVFRSAVAQNPDEVAYHHNLGVALARHGDRAGAKAALDKALAIDPRKPGSHYQMGLLMAAGDRKAARKHLTKAQQGFSGVVMSRMAYGEAMKASGDAVEAVRALEDGLRANTQLAQSYLALGKVAMAEEKHDEAADYFTKAKVTFHSNAIAHTRLGDAFFASKQFKQALKEWYLANQIAPQDPTPLYKLGMLARAQGKHAEARQFFKAAQARDPKGAVTRELGLEV